MNSKWTFLVIYLQSEDRLRILLKNNLLLSKHKNSKNQANKLEKWTKIKNKNNFLQNKRLALVKKIQKQQDKDSIMSIK